MKKILLLGALMCTYVPSYGVSDSRVLGDTVGCILGSVGAYAVIDAHYKFLPNKLRTYLKNKRPDSKLYPLFAVAGLTLGGALLANSTIFPQGVLGVTGCGSVELLANTLVGREKAKKLPVRVIVWAVGYPGIYFLVKFLSELSD